MSCEQGEEQEIEAEYPAALAGVIPLEEQDDEEDQANETGKDVQVEHIRLVNVKIINVAYKRMLQASWHDHVRGAFCYPLSAYA